MGGLSGPNNASKAAVVAFTQSLARDYAPDNIRVNGAVPGEVRTPMLESNLALSRRSIDLHYAGKISRVITGSVFDIPGQQLLTSSII